MSMKHVRIGPLTLSVLDHRPKVRDTTLYADWHGFDDPRHLRIVIGRHPVWRPFSVRMGLRDGPAHEWRIGRLEVLHYGPVTR